MIKVVITGVESTGKSSLVQALAEYYQAASTTEFARSFLLGSNGLYIQSDLIKILQGQFDLEAMAFHNNSRLLICDTGPLVIKIWSQFKYGSVDPKIEIALKSYQPDLYIIPHIEDVNYEEDPLRENPEDREVLFNLYLKELSNQEVPFLIAHGSFEERIHQAKSAIETLLNT